MDDYKTGTIYENSPNREAPNKHEKGSRRYREKIHKESKQYDNWGNLPFTFTRPTKKASARRDVLHRCDHCSVVVAITKHTAGRICSKCKKYCSVTKENTFPSERDLQNAIEVSTSTTDPNSDVSDV